jgi:hypothetical protein
MAMASSANLKLLLSELKFEAGALLHLLKNFQTFPGENEK